MLGFVVVSRVLDLGNVVFPNYCDLNIFSVKVAGPTLLRPVTSVSGNPNS